MAGILLVHGGWHGPWCWDQFADRIHTWIRETSSLGTIDRWAREP